MSLTSNTYTGDGSTVLFSFTFPYLDQADVKVELNGSNTTAYTFDNATTVRLNTAPAVGASIRIYRRTPNELLQAEFYPGSAIRAQDLNDDFTQILYATQESTATTDTANANSEVALLAAQQSIATANDAKSTAEGAATVAGSAIQKADTAKVDSATAVAAANAADIKADAALTAVSQAVSYTIVENVAAIPLTPADSTYIEVADSRGIENVQNISDRPGSFVGDSGLSVRLVYKASGGTWGWLGYQTRDPETRYTTAAAVAATYQDKAGMSAYQDKAGMTAYQDKAGMSAYLTTTAASSTYQPKSAMSSYLTDNDIGVRVEAYDDQIAKLNVEQNFTVPQTFQGIVKVEGGCYQQLFINMVNSTIDASTGNYFYFPVSANASFTVVNVPATGQVYAFSLEILYSSGTVTWPTGTTWAGALAPTLTPGTHIITFVTRNGGTTWRAIASLGFS